MTTWRADVAVIGGGLGGVAAALAALDGGATVLLTEAEDVIGGQVTSQLVAPLDEHPLVESTGVTASYRDFRNRVRAAYGGVLNPGGGWVSRLCFEPLVALRVLEDMLAPYVTSGRLVVLTRVRPVATTMVDGQVTTVHLEDATGTSVDVTATVFADATELGDLLPITRTPWVVGSEGWDAYQEPHALPGPPQPRAEQPATWCAAVVLDPESSPVGPAPDGYASWRDSQPFSLTIAGWDGVPHGYRMFTDGPDGRPPFWTYRRVRDGTRLGGHAAAVINWAGNDYADVGLVADPARARRESRALTLAFVHWLRTQCRRDDGGVGYPEIRLAPEVAGTADGLAAAPYVRESRRLRISAPVNEHDIAPVVGSERATPMPGSVGVAWYHADLHARVGGTTPVYAETAPFQIPIRSLMPASDGPRNLIAAAKNLGATQVAAAAYRVHPAEWAVGEAAGVLAALSVSRRQQPAVLARRADGVLAVQRALLRRGAPLVWASDVTPAHPSFVAGQLLAAHGGLVGRRSAQLAIAPDEVVDDVERAALAVACTAVTSAPGSPDGATWAEVVDSLLPTVTTHTPRGALP